MGVCAAKQTSLERSASHIVLCKRLFLLSKTPSHSRFLTMPPQRALLLCAARACISLFRMHSIALIRPSRIRLLLCQSRRCFFQLVEARAISHFCVGPEDCSFRLNVGMKTSYVIPGQKASYRALWRLVFCWQWSSGSLAGCLLTWQLAGKKLA